MIYYTDRIDQIDTDALLPFLSAERLEYQSRYRFKIDRTQSILAYILLRIGLMEEYGITELLRLQKSQTGKPFLIDHPEIYFNLSHCKKGVACAISSAPIGVDIQDYVPFDEGIAKQFMTKQEIELARRDPTDREFSRIWAIKESCGKHSGSGICYDLTNAPAMEGTLPNGTICKCRLLDEFALGVCAQQQMNLVKLSVNDILEKCRKLAERIF